MSLPWYWTWAWHSFGRNCFSLAMHFQPPAPSLLRESLHDIAVLDQFVATATTTSRTPGGKQCRSLFTGLYRACVRMLLGVLLYTRRDCTLRSSRSATLLVSSHCGGRGKTIVRVLHQGVDVGWTRLRLCVTRFVGPLFGLCEISSRNVLGLTLSVHLPVLFH